MLQKKYLFLITGTILTVILVSVFILNSKRPSLSHIQTTGEADPSSSGESESVVAGPQAHVSPNLSAERVQSHQAKHGGIREDSHYAASLKNPFGRVKPVPTSDNKTVAAVHRAIQPATRDASQLTVLAEPKPFDLVAYKKNPEAYTSLSVPARAFRPAQPAAGIPRIQRIGSARVTIKQGENATLKVRAVAGHPVTFTSLDMGRFEGSQLTSETVIADQSGIATVEFKGATGSLYDCDIQAASPTSSGTVRWVINIQPTVDVFADMNAQSIKTKNVESQKEKIN